MIQSSRLFFFTAFVIISSFVSISWYVQNRLSEEARIKLGEILHTVVNTSHNAVITWLDEHKATATAWANSIEVKMALRSALNIPPEEHPILSTQEKQRLDNWFKNVQLGDGYLNYAIVDRNNNVLISSDNSLQQNQKISSYASIFMSRIWSGETPVRLPIEFGKSGPPEFIDLSLGSEYLLIGAPIYNDAQQIIGALIFQHRLHVGFNQIIQVGKIGLTGETYAFNKQGILITESRFNSQLEYIGLLKRGEKSAFNIKLLDPKFNLLTSEKEGLPDEQSKLTVMADNAISGNSGLNLDGYRDYRGVMVVGAWIWDPEFEFGIATEQDLNEAYQVLQQSLYAISTFTALGIVLLLGLTNFFILNAKRKKAERALQTSRARFEAQYRDSPIPSFTWQKQDDDFVLVDYNNEAINWTQGKIANLKGMQATQLYPDRQDIIGDINRCYSGKKTIRKEYPYTLKSTGIETYLDVTYAYIPESYVLVQTDDIAHRKQAEEIQQEANIELGKRVEERTRELQETNAELSQEITRRTQAEYALRTERDKAQYCIDNVKAIIVGLDQEGKITLINQPGCALLGRNQDELLGKNWFKECLPEEDYEPVFQVHKQVVQGQLQGVERFENYILSQAGERRLIAWNNSYLTDENGKIKGSLSVGEDITERRQQEELTRAREAQIAHFSRITTMGEMATGLAHELNQPLTAINVYAGGCIQQLSSGEYDKENLSSALKKISHQAQRAANIIQNLRQFLSKGKSERKHTDLNTLILQTTDLALIDVNKSAINMHYDFNKDLPLISINPVLIEQVVLNLVRNAVEAVRNNTDNASIVLKTALLNDDEIEVSISDNGHGINNNDMDKLFDPFFSKNPQGMGMGLAISRSIIEAHEGKLNAMHNPNDVGATFKFTLPITHKVDD